MQRHAAKEHVASVQERASICRWLQSQRTCGFRSGACQYLQVSPKVHRPREKSRHFGFHGFHHLRFQWLAANHIKSQTESFGTTCRTRPCWLGENRPMCKFRSSRFGNSLLWSFELPWHGRSCSAATSSTQRTQSFSNSPEAPHESWSGVVTPSCRILLSNQLQVDLQFLVVRYRLQHLKVYC